MASSEQAFTTLGSSAKEQHGLTDEQFFRSRPQWRQIALDFVLMSFALSIAPTLLGEGVPRTSGELFSLPPLALATMISVIFLFCGAYPRYPSPVGIADTEGVIRGIGCAALLAGVMAFATHTWPSNIFLATASLALVLPAVERECRNILRPQARIAAPIRWLDDAGLHRPSAAVLLVKRTVDVAGAATLLTAAIPFMAAVAVLIKINSRGPAFIRQRRIGNCGVPFYMWKFRSMHASVARYARSPISDTDPRLTSLGRALRRFSIDELPQLFNVLAGDMSLVGPRPEMPFVVKMYDARQKLRLCARPGITGLWQVSSARARPIHENVELDLYYIQNLNIFLDLAILLRTLTAVVRGIGAA